VLSKLRLKALSALPAADIEESFMWKMLLALNKNLFIAIPVMLLMGFACGILCDPTSLKHVIVPLTFLEDL
jgi:hypothetical protein